MPDLPAVTLTTAQYSRVKAVIDGDTNAEKAAAYQRMVRDMLRRLVIDADVRAARDTADTDVATATQAAHDNPDNP